MISSCVCLDVNSFASRPRINNVDGVFIKSACVLCCYSVSSKALS